jgi:hypothetical protein
MKKKLVIRLVLLQFLNQKRAMDEKLLLEDMNYP